MWERELKKVVISGNNEKGKKLLEQLGMECEIFECDGMPELDGKELSNEMKIQEIAHYRGTCAAKQLIDKKHYNFVIIAVETAAIFNNKILKIPKTKAQITSILKNLSGKTHRIVTGICVWWGNKGVTVKDETLVTFREIPEEEINRYVQEGDYSYVGGYDIQGAGAAFVEKIEGSWFNLMGMPINMLYGVLEEEFLFRILGKVDCGLWKKERE